ncbi:DUF1796 family putative cysteine peptidase [Paenibacillus koleovorans]|uniref:DUF1796 family putative cysteine peptidase n=1 Tax=Paenibacillus koleovorans TaxID=121608 RepID=UPI000FDB2235|nr:DUF1796 family putative cysteine peptidase [Paenibacillus koleovorans]
MQLQQLKGRYDAVYSLGSNCLPGMQLRKNKLTSATGVLDWMISESLGSVNQLLQNRFSGFMQLPNMTVTGFDHKKYSYMVRDAAYGIYSVHDFPVERNPGGRLLTYSEFQEKIERRVRRFLNHLAAGRSFLFIRTDGSYQEAAELQATLANLIHSEFRVLLVQHTSRAKGIVEQNGGLEHVSVVELPNQDIWDGNDALWRELLSGVTLVK